MDRIDRRIHPRIWAAVERAQQQKLKPRIYVNPYGTLHKRSDVRWICEDSKHSHSATTPLFAYRGWARKHGFYGVCQAAHKIKRQTHWR